jgi:hypothetical protein
MIDVEPLIRTRLDRLQPLPSGASEDWDDVLQRVGVRERRHPRRPIATAAIVVAVIAGLAFSPAGAAIANGIGDFSAWVRGDPGEPATPAEQRALDESNGRSWAGFPSGAKLRRLIKTEVSGTTFTLYGFRSGDNLCLRLAATIAVSPVENHCAPLQALRTAKTPAFVVATDEGFGVPERTPPPGEYLPTDYSATFGIAADEVKAVSITADDGEHDARVASNSFLYVADHPKVGVRVRRAEAVTADGSRVALRLQPSPFGMLDLPPPPAGEAQGPTHADREVRGGTIGWIERHEERGDPVPPDLLKRLDPMTQSKLGDGSVFGRMIQPDPGDEAKIVVLTRRQGGPQPNQTLICSFFVESDAAGGGCSALESMFERGPFTFSLGGGGADQYMRLIGLASDDVADLKIFLASGAVVRASLRDNAFVARVARADFPIRLVGYDRDGRSIGIETFASDGMTSPAPPEARKSVRELARVRADGGATAVLRAGTAVGGYRCWSLDFSGGSGGGGCTPWPVKEKPLLLISAAASGADVFLNGQLPPTVARVTVTYPGGSSASIAPIDDFLVYPIPKGRLANHNAIVVALRAYDADGNQIDQRGLRVTR